MGIAAILIMLARIRFFSFIQEARRFIVSSSRKHEVQELMPQVISASRRTDIPAFYADWFVNRLKAGFAFVQHPFTRMLFRVSLRPEDVSTIIFWSKNFAPILNRLERIEQTTKNLFFHFTITANKALEQRVPDFQDAVQDYIYLAKRFSPEQIIWRYDPICVTDKLSIEVFEEQFSQCADLLKGHTRKCIISFINPYKKAVNNLKKFANQALLDLSSGDKRKYVLRLAERANKYGIQLFACCNDELVSETIKKARCIDGQYLSAVFNAHIDTRAASSRKECACTKSMDIGAYDTCAHGCLYCYATTDKDRADEALRRHDAEWNSLTKPIDETASSAFM